ncbi:sodium/calcium exchanger membrane region [Fervidicoccus fontis Kam940]|uniref:Sodium/calcium exchanger membrane region n=1 Tax=Fervidicoccus fontis (strain DSM 19380 / JCM 18336 / VKM B-2539 / Kam940) TaxID=1163730 RepID=I0A157_FERFK|nr:sodium/calcium exchanger membrane region [Fervidicoccus fontis Kam940]
MFIINFILNVNFLFFQKNKKERSKLINGSSVWTIAETSIGVLVSIYAGMLVEQLVDWISWRFKKSSIGISMILAPIFTSAPELAILLIALFEGKYRIFWGSIVSQPFMASTIVYPVIVIAAFLGYYLGKRSSRILHVDRSVAIPLLIFTLPLLPIIFLHPEKYGLLGRIYGVALLLIYFVYAKKSLKTSEVEVERRNLSLKNSILQVFVSIVLLYVGGELIVNGIFSLGQEYGLDQSALSVIITPLAGIIPEFIVGLIFVIKGRDSEGISVIIGEKALFGTFYPAIALILNIYELSYSSVSALAIALIISPIEAIAIYFGYFGVTAPIGLAGYIWYVIDVLF